MSDIIKAIASLSIGLASLPSTAATIHLDFVSDNMAQYTVYCDDPTGNCSAVIFRNIASEQYDISGVHEPNTHFLDDWDSILWPHIYIFAPPNRLIDLYTSSPGSSSDIANGDSKTFQIIYETNVESLGLTESTAIITNSISGNIETTYLAPNVSTIPLPATVWLFASGLIGLLGFVTNQRGRFD